MGARVMGGAVSVLWVALAASGSLKAQGPEASGAEGDDIEDRGPRQALPPRRWAVSSSSSSDIPSGPSRRRVGSRST